MFLKFFNPFVAAIIYIFFLLIILLYPFDITYRENNFSTGTRWISHDNGIELFSVSAIRSLKPPKRLFDAMLKGDGITLEIWLSPENVYQDGPARIVSYSIDTSNRNFTLGQVGRDLIFRLRTTKSDLNGQPELFVKDVFISNTLQHVVVTYDSSKEAVYVNSRRLIKTSICNEGKFSNWDPSYFLVLGNEVTGNRAWLGRIYNVAIYNRALSHREILKNYKAGKLVNRVNAKRNYDRVSNNLIALYLFNEDGGEVIIDHSGSKSPLDLHILRELSVIRWYKFFLKFPYSYGYKEFRDMLINIILFIPFGFILHFIIKRRLKSSRLSFAVILIFGMLFSLSIESLQYFINSRYSSMTDVINNTIGVMIGISINRSSFRYFNCCN